MTCLLKKLPQLLLFSTSPADWVVLVKNSIITMNTQLPPELINAVLAKSEELPEGTPVVKGYTFYQTSSF